MTDIESRFDEKLIAFWRILISENSDLFCNFAPNRNENDITRYVQDENNRLEVVKQEEAEGQGGILLGNVHL